MKLGVELGGWLPVCWRREKTTHGGSEVGHSSAVVVVEANQEEGRRRGNNSSVSSNRRRQPHQTTNLPTGRRGLVDVAYGRVEGGSLPTVSQCGC